MSQTVKQLVGQKVEVDFGDIAYQLYFETDRVSIKSCGNG